MCETSKTYKTHNDYYYYDYYYYNRTQIFSHLKEKQQSLQHKDYVHGIFLQNLFFLKQIFYFYKEKKSDYKI